MNRRKMIKVIGLGASTLAFGSTITACNTIGMGTDQPWNGPTEDEKDIRLKVLSYAILAANPHNIQPWVIHITGDRSFDLYVDSERLLPETDPYFRQIHIGQGTFLETVAIAASANGHEAKIQYFPDGMYGNTELKDKPVASIELIATASVKRDPLFEHLLLRHSNKRDYDNSSLSSFKINALHKFHKADSTSQLTIVDAPTVKDKMVAVLTRAMEIEVGHHGRDMETIKMFRFNSNELHRYRDGFGLAQAGFNGVTRLFAETLLLSRESVERDPSSFNEKSLEATLSNAQSTKTYAWISTKGNSRLDQVLAGRDYCRINLKTTEMGLAQHPMSQVLQEYEDMLPLQAAFKSTFNINAKDTVQMLFRLGNAEPTPHSPRRLVSEIIRDKANYKIS